MAKVIDQKNWKGMAQTTSEDTLQSFRVLFISLASLILTIIAWVATGICIVFGKLSEGCFIGARYLKSKMAKVEWDKTKEIK